MIAAMAKGYHLVRKSQGPECGVIPPNSDFTLYSVVLSYKWHNDYNKRDDFSTHLIARTIPEEESLIYNGGKYYLLKDEDIIAISDPRNGNHDWRDFYLVDDGRRGYI